jgi:FkbM family methyltransferase
MANPQIITRLSNSITVAPKRVTVTALRAPRALADRLKQVAQGLLHSVGFHVHRYPERYSQERHLGRFLQSVRVNCVLDVGAHEGEFYELLRQSGYRGKIISFEPVPQSFAMLQRRAASDPLWRGVNVALGSEPGSLPINLPASSGFASFLTPNEYCEARFPHARWSCEQVDVRVETLDRLAPALLADLDEPRLYLKMDTQGWDMHVLEGAMTTMPSIVAFQSEVSAIPIYEGMHDFAESISSYQKLGFSLVELFPVTYDDDDLRVIEYDCIMARPGAGDRAPAGLGSLNPA